MAKRPSKRSASDPFLASMAASYIGASSQVTARMAENLATVLACVSAISTAIASLPAYVYRNIEGRRELAESHALMRLIRTGPNDHQSWPDFVEWLVASTLLRGNGLVEIVTGQAGQITGLQPLPWEWVSVQLLASGRLVYDVSEITSIMGGAGRMRRLLQDEVLHLRDRSDDGLIGRSRLHRAASVVAAGISVQQFSESLWSNQVTPNGAVSFPGKVTAAQMEQLRDHINKQHAGASNARKFMVLSDGAKFESISMTAEDAELLSSRRFTVEELARLYQVPPPIIGDLSHGTFTNSETAGRWFAQHTLSPWIRKLEAVIARTVFTESERGAYEVEFDLSGFLRGDPETRWKSHEIAVKNNILTTNEVREIEGWNPRPETGGVPQPPAQ